MIISAGSNVITNVMGTRFGPAWFAANLTSILGGTLNGLWMLEDAVVSPLNRITSIPARIGETIVNVINYTETSTVNGRVSAARNTEQGVYTGTGAVTGTSYFCVSKFDSVLNPYESPFSDKNAGSPCFVRNGSTNQWITAPYLIQFYLDSIISATIPTEGIHMNECESTGYTFTTGVAILNNASIASRAWGGKVLAVWRANGAITPAQRSAMNALSKLYWNY